MTDEIKGNLAKKFLTISIQFLLCFSNVHRKHDIFRGHGGHAVRKTVGVDTINGSSKSILAIADSLSTLNHITGGPYDGEVDIEKTTFRHFKCKT